ncbi:MAG: glycosyltransferase family 9 protein [bacterium]
MKEILIFHQGSLGDTIICIPAIRAIRRHYGEDAKITLLHEQKEVLRVQPQEILGPNVRIDEYASYQTFQHGKWRQLKEYVSLWLKLRKGRYAAVFYLLTNTRTVWQARRDKAFFAACGIRQKIGFDRRGVSSRVRRMQEGRVVQYDHESQIHLQRLREAGINISLEQDISKPFLLLSENAIQRGDAWLKEQGLDAGVPLIAIAPATNMPSKQWPVERFAAIVEKLMDWEKAHLVFLGAASDNLLIKKICQGKPRCHNAAGMLSPLESAAVIKRCKFIFGLDTGTVHLAGAQGVPCLALYSERNYPGQWDPTGEGHILLRNPVKCQGCGLAVCNQPGHPCMNGISVEEVWKHMEIMAGCWSLLN